jgi:hypothetical protein
MLRTHAGTDHADQTLSILISKCIVAMIILAIANIIE